MPKTQLKTTPLGTTGLEITRIGFGAWAIGGGGWEFGWGPQEDDESVAAIHRALEQGINWIDTAAAYGFGHSESIVGRALEGLAERPYVFTKGSLLEGPGRRVVHSLRRDSLMREAEASLQRLGVDAIDLYQIHWPDPAADIEEGWAALAELKDRGLVRHIGVSNFDVEQLRRIQQIAPVETLQPPYSLVDRAVEDDILPFAEREGIGVIAYSPMGSGLLSGAMTRERIAALPGRRLAQARRALHRAGALAPPGDRRAPGGRRRAPRHHGGSRRDRLDARQPRGGRRHRRLPPPGAGRPLDGRRRPRARARGPRGDRRGLMSTPADTSRRPGRPRSERARKAILQAAADLLLDEGTAQVSMDAVAERAGVSKATIYRWWPSKERLALDALLEWAGPAAHRATPARCAATCSPSCGRGCVRSAVGRSGG